MVQRRSIKTRTSFKNLLNGSATSSRKAGVEDETCQSKTNSEDAVNEIIG